MAVCGTTQHSYAGTLCSLRLFDNKIMGRSQKMPKPNHPSEWWGGARLAHRDPLQGLSLKSPPNPLPLLLLFNGAFLECLPHKKYVFMESGFIF